MKQQAGTVAKGFVRGGGWVGQPFFSPELTDKNKSINR
jgi:hypothetical protein